MKLLRKLLPWLAAAAVIVITFGTIYAVTQQAQRSAADSPQIQLAEDAAAVLDHGANPQSVFATSVDMRSSLAPFVVVYDKSGRAIGGSGYLDGKLPAVPYGVLTAASGKDYHRVTWEPAAGVRIAAVSVAAKNYYVLSGRSMREVERNITRTLELTAFGCLAALAVLLITFSIQSVLAVSRR